MPRNSEKYFWENIIVNMEGEVVYEVRDEKNVGHHA